MFKVVNMCEYMYDDELVCVMHEIRYMRHVIYEHEHDMMI